NLVRTVKIKPAGTQLVPTAAQSRQVVDVPVCANCRYRYWRQLVSGEVLVGGWRDTTLETEKTYDDEPTQGIQEHLDRAARGLGAEGEVTHRWAGTMGFTESGLPLAGLGEGMPNVYVCGGFTGHG